MPELWGGDGEATQEVLDLGRAVSTYEREKPGRLPRLIRREIGPKNLGRWWSIQLRLARRAYRAHLVELRRELREGIDVPMEDFEKGLRESPEVYFYARMVLPALLLCRTTPQRMLRQVRSATSDTVRIKALGQLVRLDPLAGTLPEVQAWVNVENGVDRLLRQRQVLRWQQQGLDYDKFDRV